MVTLDILSYFIHTTTVKKNIYIKLQKIEGNCSTSFLEPSRDIYKY